MIIPQLILFADDKLAAVHLHKEKDNVCVLSWDAAETPEYLTSYQVLYGLEI